MDNKAIKKVFDLNKIKIKYGKGNQGTYFPCY